MPELSPTRKCIFFTALSVDASSCTEIYPSHTDELLDKLILASRARGSTTPELHLELKRKTLDFLKYVMPTYLKKI